MSRYIDADALLEYLDLMYDKQNDMDEPFNCAVLGVINYIKHRTPSIDIVRCKECIFADEDKEAEMCRCLSATFPFWNRSDFFCADGERREQ